MTSSGAPTPEQVLKSLLDAGEVSQVNVKWGKGYRDVIIVGSKKYQYKKGGTVNKILRNKIIPLYISMSDKSLNNNSDNTNVKGATLVDVTVSITFTHANSNEPYSMDYNIPVFTVTGGKNKIANN